MRFLRRASSFLNGLRSDDSAGENVVSKAIRIISGLSLIKIIFPLAVIVIIGLIFLSFLTTYNYQMNILQLVDSNENSENTNKSTIVGGKGTLTSEQRQKIVDFAYSQLGVSYNFGNNYDGSGGSCDRDKPGEQLSCNGLTRWAYYAAGVEIPCDSVGQMSSGPYVTSLGKVSDMTAGDIICYDYAGRVNRPDIDYGAFRGTPYATHHVAIYIGNGEMIESSFSGVSKKVVSDYEYSYSITW